LFFVKKLGKIITNREKRIFHADSDKSDQIRSAHQKSWEKNVFMLIQTKSDDSAGYQEKMTFCLFYISVKNDWNQEKMPFRLYEYGKNHQKS